MKIETKEIGDIVLLKIIGEVDLYNAPEIKQKIKDYCDENKTKIIIDLEKVTYIDSSGLASLISSFSNLKKLGGGLKILKVCNTVKKIFDLTKLYTFFDIYENEEQALKDFKT